MIQTLCKNEKNSYLLDDWYIFLPCVLAATVTFRGCVVNSEEFTQLS